MKFFTFTICAALAYAQTPLAPTFTATTDNVGGAHDSIRIDLVRWSTDAELGQLMDAWNLKPVAGAARGGGRGGAAAGDDDPTDPFGSFRQAQAPGGGRGGAPSATRKTPQVALADALAKVPTVGYIWSSEVSGYAVRGAVRLPQPDGGERILLLTDRRLGAWNNQWRPAGEATNYPFSLIELRVNAKGEGEGKLSLTGKVIADKDAKAVALENYAALPVVLKNVKRKAN